MVVTGRFLKCPRFSLSNRISPFLRFLEQPRVYYPGVELVVDVDLATSTDLYLDDHQLDGERLLPAVMGLEAMAQVAMGLTGSTQPPIFEEAEIQCADCGAGERNKKIRVAALLRDNGFVEVAVRSEESDFQVDHFTALCRFEKPTMFAS